MVSAPCVSLYNKKAIKYWAPLYNRASNKCCRHLVCHTLLAWCNMLRVGHVIVLGNNENKNFIYLVHPGQKMVQEQNPAPTFYLIVQEMETNLTYYLNKHQTPLMVKFSMTGT